MDPMTIALLGSALVGLVSTGYNLYNNYRDRKYQEDLQETMFEREDNSVQRRIADLEAAGINPNLAAGSGAAAGNVVARSNTNDVDFGSMYDLMKATGQIAQQKLQRKNAEIENSILNAQDNILSLDEKTKLAQTMYQLGLPFTVQTIQRGDKFDFKVKLDDSDEGNFTWNTDRPLIESLKETLKTQQYQNKYLDKELDWQTANNIINAISSFSGFIPKLNFSKKLN